MYLSKVRLANWRSYADATFVFPKPTSNRPLVLIGAMNGHGKTSFLVGMYLGLYGRYGLRYCEGASNFSPEQIPYYRKAVTSFRRNTAPGDEPTEIELVFRPTLKESDEEEIRIVRKWFFTSANQPRQGDNFETVELYKAGRPLRLDVPDTARDRLEKYLFPAHVMPAFFFDGEQAQMLINNAGEQGIKKAVEVMFGTKIIDEVRDQVRQYLLVSASRLGGKKHASQKEKELQEKRQEREDLNKQIAYLQKEQVEIEDEKERLEGERREAQETLARLGGEKALDARKIQAEVLEAEREKTLAEEEMVKVTNQLGLCLAVSRLATPITHRLEAEEILETWERLRKGTLENADKVLAAAIPEPPSSDPLLGSLSEEVRDKVRDRFRAALAQIYNPPPHGCATEYRLGHVKGELRQTVSDRLAVARRYGACDVRAKAKRLKEARETYEEAVARSNRLANLPNEFNELVTRINGLNSQVEEASRRLTTISNEIRKLKADLHIVNVRIGELQEEISSLQPEQRRLTVGERVQRVLDELTEKLRPITLRHLERVVSKHFLSIADKRFRGGQIAFPADGSPVFNWPSGKHQPIETMSGFERRSFGIAFSLALAEITQKRVPLVIDTPLGNADSEYRPRLLEALTNVDLDQIIILTHDQEVNGDVLRRIEQQVSQKFLVTYDEHTHSSIVHENAYFEGVTV